jgi:hypothetical protein
VPRSGSGHDTGAPQRRAAEIELLQLAAEKERGMPLVRGPLPNERGDEIGALVVGHGVVLDELVDDAGGKLPKRLSIKPTHGDPRRA